MNNKINELSNVSVVKSANESVVDTMYSRYLLDRYDFGIDGISILKFDSFLKHLNSKYPNQLKIAKMDHNIKKKEIIIETNENFKADGEITKFLINVLVFSGEAYVDLFANSIKAVESLFLEIKPFKGNDAEPKIRQCTYYYDRELNFRERYIEKKNVGDTDYRFYPDFEGKDEIDGYLKDFTLSNENILILSGDSGIGKTKFTRLYLNFLLNNHDLLKKVSSDENAFGDDEEDDIFINVAYVKNQDILSLDKFWLGLEEFGFNVVVLDDLDSFLAPRVSSSNTEEGKIKDKFISQLLSYTDGLYPTNTKFIISTNQPANNIDKAIIRDGRLFEMLSFRKLKNEEALEIWKSNDLLEQDFLNIFKDQKEILQANLGKEIHAFVRNNKKKRKNFLKEDSVAAKKEEITKDKTTFTRI